MVIVTARSRHCGTSLQVLVGSTHNFELEVIGIILVRMIVMMGHD